MGIIVDRTQEAFKILKEGLKEKKPIVKLIEIFSTMLIEIADSNIRFQWHRDILDNEVERQFQLMRKE